MKVQFLCGFIFVQGFESMRKRCSFKDKVWERIQRHANKQWHRWDRCAALTGAISPTTLGGFSTLLQFVHPISGSSEAQTHQ